MNSMRVGAAMAASAAALILAACGGGGNGSPYPFFAGTPGNGTPTQPPPDPGPGTNEPPPVDPPAPQARACTPEALSDVVLQDAKITGAEVIAAGATRPNDLPAFCRITGQSTPSTSSLINFEVWIPEGAAWNGKMVVTGNGGYSPSLSTGDMAHAMRQGYAVVGGDTGHQTNDMAWGINQPEKIKDWGTRSIHAITVPSKQLIAGKEAKAPARSYYYGCSTGGHQGYAQIQDYPEDFDGVIAGAPGNNRTRLNVEFLHRFLSNRATNTNTPTILISAKAQLITRSAVAACDALDGVTDGVIDDPRACTPAVFDVASLQCSGADGANCLTAPQVEAAKKIYAGPRNPRTGEQIYPGQPVGTESAWPSYWGGAAPTRAEYWSQWVFQDPQWNWWNFDFDQDLRLADFVVSPLVDHVDPDISRFKARGAKALVYVGWQDAVVNPLDTIDYYEKVRSLQGSQQATDEFFRLFMVPGMGHCSGGSGATLFGNQNGASPTPSPRHDLLMALDEWVEKGTAPDSIIASRVSGGTVVRTRPLCKYPTKAVYSGQGSSDDAANFTCQ